MAQSQSTLPKTVSCTLLLIDQSPSGITACLSRPLGQLIDLLTAHVVFNAAKASDFSAERVFQDDTGHFTLSRAGNLEGTGTGRITSDTVSLLNPLP